MALPPGYLALLEAARECGLEVTQSQATRMEDHMRVRGWVIAAAWQVDPSRNDAPLSDRRGALRTVTVFTHPSGEDQVEDVFEEVSKIVVCHGLNFVHVSLGEYEVRSCGFVLGEVARRLHTITGVRVQW